MSFLQPCPASHTTCSSKVAPGDLSAGVAEARLPRDWLLQLLWQKEIILISHRKFNIAGKPRLEGALGHLRWVLRSGATCVCQVLLTVLLVLILGMPATVSLPVARAEGGVCAFFHSACGTSA